MELTVSASDPLSASLTSSYQMDSALQNTLRRVSREIQVRRNAPKDNKQPLPPVYEMVGNSVAYQLLLQSHPGISVDLINSTYPVLKNLQSSAQWLYDDYLDLFKAALKKKATPKCLHPADTPTVKFLVDLCVHASSIPIDEKNAYVAPIPSLWMHLLSIFSASPQNQSYLVEYRCSSKIVGCMNLTRMADDIRLQCYGWEVLSNILECPPKDVSKPAVHVQAVTLLLSHIRRQCEQFYHDDNLMKAVLKFLSKLTSITRACSLVTSSPDSDTPLSYSKEDALEIISLMEKTSIRQVLLDLPEHLQDDFAIKAMLQSVLLSLAPVIQVPLDDTVVAPSTRSNRRPPPKPKRSKVRSQYFRSADDDGQIRSPRKLPEIPISKRMSTCLSSENIDKALDCVRSSTNNCDDSEYSLPAGIISRGSVKKKQHSVSPQDIETATEPRPRTSTYVIEPDVSTSKPVSLTGNVTGPEQLPHYNRVSLKRTRGSYIKAVTSSQVKHDSREASSDSLQAKDILAQVENQTGIVLQALEDRKEMITSLVQLWKADKALQAASNLVMSCFFNGEADFPLFTDCLDCFCCYPSQWSLGICIVLLPYVRRTASSVAQLKYLKSVNTSIKLILKRFSVIILGIKKNTHVSRVHLEQRQACYHELHLLFTTITKLKKSNENDEEVEKLIEQLTPFNQPLA